MREAPRDPRVRSLFVALGAVLLVLAATAEERTAGTIVDEQQMLYTAVSMAELGEIGIARGARFTVHRKEGDAVSPYGMGLSLVEAVPAFLASGFERAFGPGSSQTLLSATQVLLVALAAAVAGLLALALGAAPSGVAVATVGTALASPLWPYIGACYAEPLQAAALALAILLALRGGQARSRRPVLLAALGGAAAGMAVLAKATNVALLPFLVVPLLLDGDGTWRAPRRIRLLGAWCAGAAPVLGAWLAFEIVRFGKPLASYGGQGFTHPPLDGLWRLLVGPNKGIVLYFPLAVLAAIGAAALVRRREVRGTALALAGIPLLLLLLASAWFAWDGTVGWGPRLLVPAVPLLAACAGVAVGESRARLRGAQALLVVGGAVNILGVLQSEAASSAYLLTVPPLVISAREAARYPDYYLAHAPDGRWILPPAYVAAEEAALSPFRVHAFLLSVRLGSADAAEAQARLASPPWASSRPDLVPEPGASSNASDSIRKYLVTPFAWPHLFSAMAKPRDERAAAFNTAWNNAIADQVLRALDVGKAERAVTLAERLFELTPSGYSAALYAESLRAAGRRETLDQLLGSLPPEYRSSPSLAVVQALRARDRGDEPAARAILAQVARVFRRPGVLRAIERPMSEWPAGLHGMTGESLAGRKLELPRVGK